MESERGRTLFKFDRSLMERLADSGFPMSQINVQRRMRPEISHFIRCVLQFSSIINLYLMASTVGRFSIRISVIIG